MTASVPEEAFGFHVQQAAEKSFKAWLAFVCVDSEGEPVEGAESRAEGNAVWGIQSSDEVFDVGAV